MPPRKRGGGSGGGGGRSGFSAIFCCFNNRDHPEITYKLRDDFALQSMEPSLPMPGNDELDSMFAELVVRHCSIWFFVFCTSKHLQKSVGNPDVSYSGLLTGTFIVMKVLKIKVSSKFEFQRFFKIKGQYLALYHWATLG